MGISNLILFPPLSKLDVCFEDDRHVSLLRLRSLRYSQGLHMRRRVQRLLCYFFHGSVACSRRLDRCIVNATHCAHPLTRSRYPFDPSTELTDSVPAPSYSALVSILRLSVIVCLTMNLNHNGNLSSMGKRITGALPAHVYTSVEEEEKGMSDRWR